MRVKAWTLVASLGLVALAGSMLGASCGERQEPQTPNRVVRPQPDLRFVVLTDLKGYLEPCGCTSHPLGGIDRMAAKVQALRGDGVPTVLLATGNLFFSGGGHHTDLPGAEAQEAWKAETIVDIFNQLEVAGVTPGRGDLEQGTSKLLALRERAEFPFLGAGVELSKDARTDRAHSSAETETPETQARESFRASIVKAVGGVQVGVVGLSALAGEEGLHDAGVQAATRLREEGADVVVVLVSGDRRLARRLGASSDVIDFVIQGGVDEAEAVPPTAAGDAYVLHGGRQGQGILVVELYRRGDGSFRDWSEWSLERERQQLESRVRDLRERIEGWEADDSVSDEDVANQRGRLSELEAELQSLRLPSEVEGNAFRAEWLALASDANRSASVTQRMTRYDRRVNEHNRELFADLTPEPVEEGQAHYVGSEACASCHESATTWWSAHAHGRAYATLVERDKQFNLSCVGCHVTGYMVPGGSTVTHNLDGDLTNVGCESCHGPGSRHLADPLAEGRIRSETPESVCVTCHNPEHSDTFNYRTYMGAVVVPGHGRPLLE